MAKTAEAEEPERADAEFEDELDEALKETFPASDPIAVPDRPRPAAERR